MKSYRRQGVRVLYVYVCWLGMLTTHEAGHLLHAWISGGQVTQLVLPWFGFSRTDLSHNPHPLFVAWGGALWCSLIPLMLVTAAAISGFRFVSWVQFFAGFCLTANGAYLAVGSLTRAGDAGDLMRHGAPHWSLVATGMLGAVVGLFLWHLLGCQHPAKQLGTNAANEDSTN